MSDYYARVRTNYFAVEDVEKYREIIAACSAQDEIEIFEEVVNGERLYAFGCEGYIDGLPMAPHPDVCEACTEDKEDCEDCENAPEGDPGAFYEALKSVLADGHAIILTEIGYEKLCYLAAVATVITKRDVQFIDLHDRSLALARDMLQDEAYSPKMDY